jgi:ABC-type Fe3+ transport system substrate-binding protein
VYSITSRIANAAKSFEAKYGIKVSAHNLKDFELIEKVSQEGKNNVYGADFIIAQDSGRVFGEIIKPGYAYSYVPEDMKNVIPKKYQDPLFFSFITKAFIYNSETYVYPTVNNVWELTEKKWEKKFWFKDPLKEGVNANFLTMVTSPEVSKQLADAYERHFGKKIALTTPNAGYEWIKGIIENRLVMFTSDTKMANALGVKGKNIEAVALGTYSKLRYRKKKNLALMPIMGMEPFAYILIGGILRNMDANLEEAAQILKAGRWRIIRKITIPIVLPAVLSTFLLVFSSAMSAFAVQAFLGSPVRFQVLTTQLFRTLNGMSPGFGYLIALVMVVIGALILTVNQILIGKRKSFATVTGKSSNISLINLKKLQTPVSLVVLGILLFITIVPLITFTVESFIVSSGSFAAENFTTEFWMGKGQPDLPDESG